ncbi:MAG: hypothetical protein ACRCTE_09510 [Cellulosilyticaceae bacterium]
MKHYDLDDLFWDNNANQYGTQMPVEKRTQMFRSVIDTRDWVIEGVYYAWVDESFQTADQIILLDIPLKVSRYRIIKRFIKRKLYIEHGKKESIKSLVEIRKKLQQYPDKVIIIHSKKELQMLRQKYRLT